MTYERSLLNIANFRGLESLLSVFSKKRIPPKVYREIKYQNN